MLTSKEAQLGSLMARIAALGTIVIFAVQALLIGPDQVGYSCLLYTSPSPRDRTRSRMPSSA